MKEFFEAYKRYIIKHPNKLEYKPTSNTKYDSRKLLEITEKLDNNIPCSEEDEKAIIDFVKISDYIYDLYAQLYKHIHDNFRHLNLKGCDIAEYIVAGLNREYKVIWNKREATLNKAEKGSYFLSDLMNFKLQSPIPEVGLIDARACLESATDTCSLLLNYLRYFLDKELTHEDFKPEEFAGRVRDSMQISQIAVVLKHSYDDILCNDGFVKIDEKNNLITFDYNNHDRLKLLTAGDMMFSEHRMQVMRRAQESNIRPRLYKYITINRIKKVKINNSCITLNFGQGEPKEHRQIVNDMQSAIDAYYEFLVGDTILPNFANSTIDEVISVWCAIQYITSYVSSNINYDISINTREDFSSVPSKMLKSDLISYVVKLTGINFAKVRASLMALEADWTKFNDIWTSMLYPVGEYYLLPFFPIIYSSPYNVIDQLMQRGGFNLEERGKQFEIFLYNQLTQKKTSFPITCMQTGRYGVQGNEEEIDVLISMKNVVLVADAKCVHYSVEPINYAEALKRLIEGCEQAIRKADFIKNNPQYFNTLGDYSSKTIIPFVITNYPTFTGFSHKDVYIIDSHSFLAYIQSGIMTMRQLTLTIDPIIGLKKFYYNEEQFSNEFIKYLSDNPVKHEFLKRIYIHDLPLPILPKPWRIISKSAQINNDFGFNISNNT